MNNLAVLHDVNGFRNRRNATVLILDDCEFDRKRIRRVMREASIRCTIVECDEIQTFAKKLEVLPHDLVLIDYNLNDGDGLDAMALCKASQINSQALFVMVTGDGSSSLAASAIEHGYDEYLNKDEVTFERMSDLLDASMRKSPPENVTYFTGERSGHTVPVPAESADFQSCVAEKLRHEVISALSNLQEREARSLSDGLDQS